MEILRLRNEFNTDGINLTLDEDSNNDSDKTKKVLKEVFCLRRKKVEISIYIT